MKKNLNTSPFLFLIEPKKSIKKAFFLTLFFGPYGMLYSSIECAILMFSIEAVLLIHTGIAGLIIAWPAAVALSILLIKR